MRISEVLFGAADYIEAHGLHKGSLAAPSGAVCVIGGIRVAAGGLVEVYPWGNATVVMQPATQCYLADDAVKRLGEHLGVWPAKWADLPTTTDEEVVCELRQCGLIEAEKEAAA